jgi:D-3-phosphoglycerate dehydrogenase / 2-oxoglutarate reductase
MDSKYSFPPEKMRILLLEGIHPRAKESLTARGYSVETSSSAMTADELKQEISTVHILGIRSKTEITSDILERALSLLAVGCFCIGTNQVDLEESARIGVPVFNAPYSNTRSVAELVIANIIMLARKAAERSAEMHRGIWTKSAAGCYEVRNKTLGIIGYGKIGSQVGVLAEAFGMKVIYYDVVPKMPFGTATATESLEGLLSGADFISLHVPETPETRNMIDMERLQLIAKGGYLLNLSRGTVVDIEALSHALRSEHLAGAAVDVFPTEPSSNSEPFSSELCGLPNTILTPHIGASTVEAQMNIGEEVGSSLLRFVETGSSTGAVNFPQVELPIVEDAHRVLNIHRNIPGVLSSINDIIAKIGANIHAQYLSTKSEVGYLIMDVDKSLSKTVKGEIDKLPGTIKTRLLF